MRVRAPTPNSSASAVQRAERGGRSRQTWRSFPVNTHRSEEPNCAPFLPAPRTRDARRRRSGRPEAVRWPQNTRESRTLFPSAGVTIRRAHKRESVTARSILRGPVPRVSRINYASFQIDADVKAKGRRVGEQLPRRRGFAPGLRGDDPGVTEGRRAFAPATRASANGSFS